MLTWPNAFAFAANLFPTLPRSACLQASPLTPLESHIPSSPPTIGEGATSLPSMLLGGVSIIRCCQTPSSGWAWRYPFIPLVGPCQALTSRCACIAGRYSQSVTSANSPKFSMSYSGSPRILADCMGASQVLSMQGTGDASRVGCTPHLLSRTLSSNDVQPSMVMALLWTPLLYGNISIAILQRLLDPKTGSPAEAFHCVRKVSSVLGGPEKDASYPTSSSHGIVARACFVKNSGSLQSLQFGLF